MLIIPPQGLSMGELPPGLDLDNIDEFLASLTPGMAEALGFDESAFGGGERHTGRAAVLSCCCFSCKWQGRRRGRHLHTPSHDVNTNSQIAAPPMDLSTLPPGKLAEVTPGLPSHTVFTHNKISTYNPHLIAAAPPMDLSTLPPGKLAEELFKRVAERVQDRVMVSRLGRKHEQHCK